MDVPEGSTADKIHTMVRAGISAIPIAGGPAVEFFNLVFMPPIERRRNQWMKEIGETLEKLVREKGISIDELEKNPQFVTSVLQATQIAIRNHDREKLDALRNAIANAALPTAPDEIRQQMFLSFVDGFTVLHLRLLILFQNPLEWARVHGVKFPDIYMGSLTDIVECAFSELKGQNAVFDLAWNDLYLKGLVNTVDLKTGMTGNGMLAKRTSDLGDEFLKFIKLPD